MPYQKKEDLPPAVKELPAHAQEIWMADFNSAWDQYQGDEEKCFAVAWAAVKNKYEKKGDEWVLKSEHSGFPEWIEVFAAGTWIDSNGVKKEWTHDDLNEIASSYDGKKSPAPIVIGHPEIDSPAYGWIDSLKVEGEKLLAKPGQLVEEFKDWVKRGLYKKISLAIYPDLTLKHVGFLGGKAPAVKGLTPVSFGEKKAGWIFEKEIQIQFADCSHMNEDGTFIGGFDGCVEHMMSCEGHDEDSAQKICAYIGRKAGKIHSEPKGGIKMTLEELWTKIEGLFKAKDKDKTTDSQTFSEADLQTKIKEAKDFAFAEAQKKIDAEKKEKDDALKKLKEIETQKRKDSIASFCEVQCKEGKLTPALRKLIEPVMIFAATHEGPIEFAEGQKKEPVEILKDFMKALPKLVEFREFAADDKTGKVPSKFMEFAEQLQTEKKISRSEAIRLAAKEKPDLHQEWIKEVNPDRDLKNQGFRS